MPMLHVELSPEVAEAIQRQACTLLMSRNQFVRSILAAVAAQADMLERGQEACPHCRAERQRTKAEDEVERQTD